MSDNSFDVHDFPMSFYWQHATFVPIEESERFRNSSTDAIILELGDAGRVEK